MKTGEVASSLGVAVDTIRNWINQPALNRFFSDSATGADGTPQRTYIQDDVRILNTIRDLRARKITDWDAIATRLDNGYRVDELPQNATTTGTRTVPYEQAEQAALTTAIQARLEEAQTLIAELRQQNSEKEKKIEELQQEVRALIRDNNNDKVESLQQEVRDLIRKLGRAEALIEILNDKNGD